VGTREKIAVVLASGGVDSAVAAACARKDCGRIAMLHVNYGQRTGKRELEAFNALAGALGAERTFVAEAAYLGRMGASSLTDPNLPVPDARPAPAAGIPSTYVPFRNANLLAIAVSWAEAICSGAVYIGAVQEDGSGYPDCRESFLRAFERAAQEGTRPETSIKIMAPLLHEKKGEIVKLGARLGVPFELTWSCYRDEIVACGRCESCVLRLKSFAAAGIKDPIPYAGQTAKNGLAHGA
jgi:7-cyano-7-deazaguanine synthase